MGNGNEAAAAVFQQLSEGGGEAEPATESPAPVEAPVTELAPVEAPPVAEPSPVETKEGRQRGPDGKFASAKPTEPAKPVVPTKRAGAETALAAPPKPGESTPTTPPEPGAESQTKAPQSLTPVEREAFAKAPAELQRLITRREAEYTRGIQQHSEAARYAQQVQQALGPFEAMVRAEGHDPVQAAADLLRQSQLFRTGAPQVKAQMVARYISNFGVDPAMVAKVLQEGPQQEQGGPLTPQAISQMVDQRWQHHQQTQVQQRQQQIMQDAHVQAQEWSQGKDFLDDVDEVTGLTVRQQMGQLMQGAAGQGKVLTFDQAYPIACKMNSVASPYVAQREAAKLAKERSASTLAAKAAGSMVRGSSTGLGSGAVQLPKPRNGSEAAQQVYEQLRSQ